MWNICQCLKLKAAVRMSDLEYVTLSSAPCVFISLRLVCRKCHKMYTPYPEDDLCQTNDRPLLQRQTRSTHLGRDKKTKTNQKIQNQQQI